MALVKLKQKGQLTLPVTVRRALSLSQGDLLEATVEDGKVVLYPKAVVDRDRRASAERFLSHAAENAASVEAQLDGEGKTWDDLDAEILEEVKAHRREQVQLSKAR